MGCCESERITGQAELRVGDQQGISEDRHVNQDHSGGEGSRAKHGVKCIRGGGNSMCKAAVQKMIIMEIHHTPGILKSNFHHSSVT